MKKKRFIKLAGATTLAALAGLSLVACGGDDKDTVYTVKLNSNDPDTSDNISVTTYDDMEVKEGSTINLPTLTYEGYTFGGWYSDVNFNNEFTKTTKVESDLTLYAKWTKNGENPQPVTTYTVSYVTAHGTAPQAVSGVTALPQTLPSIEADGFTFDGWYLDEGFATAATAGATISSNTVLYAKWTEVIPSTFDVISGKEGNFIASNFDNTQISTYGDSFQPGITGFYSADDTQTTTTKVEIKDGAMVVTDTDANASAEGIAEIGFNFGGVLEGTMKYTPTVTDSKAPSKWTLIQFYGYKNVANEASKLFGLRTNGTKDKDTGHIQVVFEGDRGSEDYNYYGTSYEYKVNTELEIYWKYDFDTKKLTITINGTAVVTDYNVPAACQPVFLTSLGFVTGGSATVRAPKIDDFAVSSSIVSLGDYKTAAKAVFNNYITAMNVDTNYTFSKNEILAFRDETNTNIDAAADKNTALTSLITSFETIDRCPSDSETKANIKKTLASSKAAQASNYTINKTAFDKVYADAEAAVDAATTSAELQTILDGVTTAVSNIKSDSATRSDAIMSFAQYATTQYNTLDDSGKTSAATEWNEIVAKYSGENGLLATCLATSIESTLKAAKDEIDDLVDKYQLSLEQYKEKLVADLNTYKASKTNVQEVLNVISSITPNFTGVETKNEADVKFEAAKAVVDDVCELYNYIQTQKATLLAYNADEEAFEATFGASFTSLWESEAGYLIDGSKNLATTKTDVDAHIATIRVATEVTVTFKNGDTTFTTATIVKNSKVTAPEGTPVNEGYAFAGWNFDFDQTISEATTIYAIWHDVYSVSSIALAKTTSTSATSGTIFNEGGISVVLAGGGVTLTEKAATSADSKYSFTHALLPAGGNRTYTFSSAKNATIVVYYTITNSSWADQNANLQVDGTAVTSYTSSKKCSGTIPAAYTLNITAGTEVVLSSNSGRLVLWGFEYLNSISSTITDITADVVAGTDKFTVSNVKLIPATGAPIAITDGYSIELYNSENQKVENEKLSAGKYTMYLLYGRYTGRVYDLTIEAVPPVYDTITYTWDGNKCTATQECINYPDLTVTETVTGQFTEVTPAGVGVNQTAKYVATFTNELFATQESNVFEVENTAIVPEYNAITYVWDEDKCTATRVCTNVPELTVTETVTGVQTVDTAAAVGVNRKDKYVATFTNPIFTTQESETFEVPGTMIAVITTEAELEEAVAIDKFGFKLGNDITLTKDITISASVSINLDNHTINAGTYRLVAYNESSTIIVSISNGTIEGNSHVLRANKNSEVTVTDLTVNTTGTGISSTNGTLIIKSATINGACAVAAYEGANVEIKNGAFTSTTETIVAQSNSTITINDGVYTSTADSALAANGGTITIINGTVNAQEFAVLVHSGGTAQIDGGEFTTVDNVVVGTNGSTGKGENTITINGGEFNGNITTSGYVACGVYVANSDTVNINGGTFNITNGVGVLARSGNTTIDSKVVFNVTGDGTLGKVGDSKVTVPSGEVLVIDYAANYPGGDPTVTNNTSEAAYILVDDEASLATAINTVGSYIVLNDDITLTKHIDISASVSINLNKHTIHTGDYRLYAYNESSTIEVSISNGTIEGKASVLRANLNSEVTVSDLTVNAIATGIASTEGTLIINSATITAASAVAAYNGANIIIKDGTYTASEEVVVAQNGSTILIKAGQFQSTAGIAMSTVASELIIDGGTVNAQEAAVMAFDAGTVEINGGTFTTVDNFVVGTNGTTGRGKNTITINGGTFNGNIKTSGYIACGIYVANDDTVVVNAGTFNIKNGVGIVARSGNTTVESAVVFDITTDGSITSGKVGDANINIEQPHELVLDLLASYPGGTPTLTNNTSYDILRLVGVSTENEFVTAINVPNSIVTLKDNITLTGYLITDLNGTIKVIVGDYYIDNTDPVHDEVKYTIQIGTNCTLICDVDVNVTDIVVAPAGYHVKTTTNTDGTYTFTVEADE